MCDSMTGSAYQFADNTKQYNLRKKSRNAMPRQEDINKMIKVSGIRLPKFNEETCMLLTVNGSINKCYCIHANNLYH